MFTPGYPHVSYNWNRTGTSEASGNAAREKFLGWQPWPWDVALLESSAIQTCHIWNFNFSGFSPFFLANLFCFISEWDSKKQLTSYINPLGTARFRACAVDSLWVNRRWWQYKTTGDGGEGMRGV
jgi:hypothetical protein